METLLSRVSILERRKIMANNTLNTRIVICNDTAANWGTSQKVILKGEYAIEFRENGEPKVKIGNGVDTLIFLISQTHQQKLQMQSIQR